MIKNITILAIILFTNLIFAQSDFDKFKDKEGIATVVVNKKMFQMMGSVKMDTNDKETQRYLDLMKKLDNLNVFTTSNVAIASDMKSTIDIYLKKAGLEQLMKVSEAGKNIKIWVKSGADEAQIKELLVFVEGQNNANETVLMTLTGDFLLTDITLIVDKMNIPGANELKKAIK